MGYAKDRMIQEWEQGWSFVSDELHVCAECFDDEVIGEFIEESAHELKCSYCDRSSDTPIACSMNRVLEVIGDAVSSGYEDPANSLPVEGGSTFSTP